VVPAWGIVTPELGAQIDQEPGPVGQPRVTAEPARGPDGTDDLLVDHALDREPGQRPDRSALLALPPHLLAGQLQLGAMADGAGRGDRFLLAALQDHLPAGQGRRVGEGRRRVRARPGGLVNTLGHCHHQVNVIPHLLGARVRDYPGRRKPSGQPVTTGGWDMEIQHSMRDGCVIVAFTGSIDLFTVSSIQRTLLKDLSEQPYALICDLSGVQHLDPVCAAVFATVANHPSRWATTSFQLCAARPAVAEILGRLRVQLFLPLHATLEEALDAAVDRPPYLRDELLLGPVSTAPAAARVFVRDILGYWQQALPDGGVLELAVLLANELVTNAVVHARTDLRLRLELRGDWLHIAVRDGSPRLLRTVTASPEAEGGRGLQLVEQLARAWGMHPHPDGGKVVWCTLKLYSP
jgi:anti-anti-sigma regulatory factor/anti-sigma regulatory factor (Ser/Thr protein kinase)